MKFKITQKGYEIQKVTGRHKTECAECHFVPKVGCQRLVVTSGSGKWAKRAVYCGRCGISRLRELAGKVSNLEHELNQWKE